MENRKGTSQKTKRVPATNMPIKKNNPKAKNKKVKFSKKHPKIAVTIRLCILLLIVALVVGSGIVVGMLYGMWGQDFEITEEELVMAGNSIVYDSEGNALAELSGDENRKVIKLEDMAENLPKAYVAIEDERFYNHNGVDFKRTTAAIGTYILHKGSSSYGGSTITQQLVKNITNETDKSGIAGVNRKVKEWAKAYQIERMLSKDQILELYLNIIFVGDRNYGVQSGAEYYFNKDAKDLSLAECAFLAGINNRPNFYNPYGDKSYKKNEEKKNSINNRTKTVLGKMLELGYINQEEYDKACEKVDKGLKFKQGTQKAAIYSYHTDATISQVIKDFMNQKGWSEEYAKTYVYGGGLKIYSTEKPDIQKKLEKQMSDNASNYQIKSRKTKDSEGNYAKSQAAMVVIDNETGYVAGLVGGLGEKTESRGLNRATQSTRSTGSSIKPIADLLPALQEGTITASTRYLDYKTKFDNGKFEPKNDGNAYSGNISIRAATAMSHNVPFVKVMAELTNATSRKYLKDMGISTISDETDVGLSLAIGGLTKGISPLEMAGAYATIANDGVYRTPLLYTKIEDSQGNSILEPKQETKEVCSKQNAYILKDILKSVINGAQGHSGTAPYCSISGMDTAVKTGTTNANKDRWLCGFTNYYTAATWYGYDVEEEVIIGGNNPAGRIWAAVMKSLHTDKKNSKFKEPDGIVTARICSKTGLKATSSCSDTYVEKFVEGTVPETCSHKGSKSARVCEESGKIANEYCPKTKTIYTEFVLPKEELGIWKTSNTSTGGKLPTEVCDIHNEESAKENAKAPKIKLIGSSSITLNVGESYTEKGATAKDDTDGDLTNQIQISGSVNSSKAGTYTLTYKVKNSLGKESTATRTVVVKDKSTPSSNTTNTTNSTTNTTTNTSTNTTTNTTNSTTNSTTNTTNKNTNTSKKTNDKITEKISKVTEKSRKNREKINKKITESIKKSFSY